MIKYLIPIILVINCASNSQINLSNPHTQLVNWKDAEKLCKTKGERLPTIEELEIAFKDGEIYEAYTPMAMVGFSNKIDRYWSSTPAEDGKYYSLVASAEEYSAFREMIGKKYPIKSNSFSGVRCIKNIN